MISQAMSIISSQLSAPPSSCTHLLLPHLCSFSSPTRPTIFLNTNHHPCRALRTDYAELVPRRTANYMPNFWDYDSMQSLTNGFDEQKYREENEKMKEYVKGKIEADQVSPLAKLELVDAVQRLGLEYRFKVEIQHALENIHKGADESEISDDLYATSLRFRLLRQHGFVVPQDVFKCFMDEAGNFKESLHDNVEGLLSLYEASFHGLKGEKIIDKAMEFTLSHLKAMDKDQLPKRSAIKVDHALDMPIHWRPNRLEARWFIDVYAKEPDMDPTLLRFAKLDYNLLQSTFIKEVGELSRWWLHLGLGKMSFFRDRLLESYLFSAAMVFEPKYDDFRVMNTKIACLLTLIDDVYDVYGLLEELELLTDFIDRWDITEIDKLPQTISTCFLALYNSTNEMGYQVMIDKGINIIPYLRKAWADHCKGYMVERKWSNPPPLNEYLNTAAITIGGPIMLLCSLFSTEDTLTGEVLDSISEIPRIMFSASLVLRLNNDLSTSPHELARGDNLKSVECYMNETGDSKEVARDHIKDLIRESWKTMNEDMSNNSSLSKMFLDACLNLARVSQSLYQYGDGYGIPNQETKEHILSILIQPVPMD